MDLPNGSVWLFDMLKLNDLYYQINHLYHPYKTLYILYRSKKLKLEPDNGEKFYVAAYGGASVLYRNPVDYAKIEQDFENGKYKKAFNRYLRKTQLITEDIGAIKKKYIDSLYDIYFRKTIEIVENEGYYNYFEFFRAAPPPEIQSPIVLYLKDTLCIMNFFNLDLIKLDTMGRYINKMKLNNEDFGLYIPQFNRLVPDVISQKMYSVSNRNGLVSMSVIDFKKGSCLEERYYLKRTPKSIYNILIYGDYVYYLAHYDTWRVGLFKEKIEYKNTEE